MSTPIDPGMVEAQVAAEGLWFNGQCYVWDPNEERSWGPFESEAEAAAFIQSDKYLESWCLVKERPWPAEWMSSLGEVQVRNFPPSDYHGRWPL